MKTILCDIDGTLTNMWPIERAILISLLNDQVKIDKLYENGINDLSKIYNMVSKKKIRKSNYENKHNKAFLKLLKSKKVPDIPKYPLVKWILKNKNNYVFVYATGGQKLKTEYILKKFKILKYFDLKNSVNKTNCRFKKISGLPFKKIKNVYSNILFFTDSNDDVLGAKKAGIKKIIKVHKNFNINI